MGVNTVHSDTLTKVLMFLFVKILMTTTDRFLLWDYILCIIVKNYCQISSFYLRNLSGLLYMIFFFFFFFFLIYLLCGFMWREEEAFCVGSLLFSVDTLRLKVKCKCWSTHPVGRRMCVRRVFNLRVDMKWRKWWAACEGEWMNEWMNEWMGWAL